MTKLHTYVCFDRNTLQKDSPNSHKRVASADGCSTKYGYQHDFVNRNFTRESRHLYYIFVIHCVMITINIC